MSNITAQEQFLDDIKSYLENDLLETTLDYKFPHIRITKDRIQDTCKWLKEKQHFIYLVDVFGTDRFTAEDRFEVIYHIFCLRTRVRVFLKIRVEEENPVVPTVTNIWRSANWNERETFDMFGIRFEGHPDMRRMFMPEDYQYYPLRKEFPLIGVPGSIELPSTTPDQV
ncbi:MAG: NADH-quinone oxidoreductase subunit C [Balneolales bacterium]